MSRELRLITSLSSPKRANRNVEAPIYLRTVQTKDVDCWSNSELSMHPAINLHLNNLFVLTVSSLLCIIFCAAPM